MCFEIEKYKIMKKETDSLIHLLGIGLVLLVGFVAMACSSDKEEEGMSMRPDISLNKETLVLEVGSSERLLASFNPPEAPNKGHTWTSNAADIASVDETGLVTAVAEGNAVITATALDGGKMASCRVQVVGEIVHVSQVLLDVSEEFLTIGGQLQLTATVLPANATDKSVKWTSSDDAIATVDGNGRVSGIAAGTVTITATSNEGGKRASCQITVEARGVHISVPEVTNVTSSTAHVSGSIHPVGVEAEEVGLCYAPTPSPTVDDRKVVLSGEEPTYTLNGLMPGTTYYVRFYATAGGRTFYGEQEEFRTTAVITTNFTPTDVYKNRILLTSSAPAGVTSVMVCYGTSPNPKITDYTATATVGEDGLLHLDLQNLQRGTTYYLRSYAQTGDFAVDYHDDEVAVQTFSEEKIEITRWTANNSSSNYWDYDLGCFALIGTIYYEIKDPGTYSVVLSGGYGGFVGKNNIFNAQGTPIYIESGKGYFDFKARGTKLISRELEFGYPYIVFQKEGDRTKYYYRLNIGTVSI